MIKSYEHINGLPNGNEMIYDFSVEGQFTGYSGKFTDSFMINHVLTISELLMVADVSVTIKDGIRFEKRNKPKVNINSEPTHLKHLDRIDQKNFPLDGKYSYPSSSGKGVNVYIIDTAKFNAVFCDGCPLLDDHGHGTMIAGIIGGHFYGVAKKTNLIGVKVLNATGSGTAVDFLNALSYVIHQHVKSENKKTVINLSFGFESKMEAVNMLVEKAIGLGINIVVAAGNEANDACGSSPPLVPDAITVGATELINNHIANFSDFGPCVDIFAPGVDIESTGPDSPVDTLIKSGTSFSAPIVTGAVALLLGEKYLSTDEVTKELIKISTKNVVKGLENLPETPNRFLRVPYP
ncbi:901_t:CDS:2 [Funneliformis mosseae]|uniref:901_t:CDS:1 n=1 Tax=Funneliformis mosseae TaxID=27381 RepID=A0A9N8ZTP0_FUNMO|nr:901_t:CDS:2 [Funneliformis mosseae]